MRIVKKEIKKYISKKGKQVDVFKVISEYNNNQTNVKNEKFDLSFSEVKKIYSKLAASGKKFQIQGLNQMRLCLISDFEGNLIYKDTQEYLNGKDEGSMAFQHFSQIIVTILN